MLLDRAIFVIFTGFFSCNDLVELGNISGNIMTPDISGNKHQAPVSVPMISTQDIFLRIILPRCPLWPRCQRHCIGELQQVRATGCCWAAEIDGGPWWMAFEGLGHRESLHPKAMVDPKSDFESGVHGIFHGF